MINFRYHVISLIAVFLALGIGIIMGTSVIDRAVVDRLERQQATLEADVDEVRSENNRLRGELRVERDAARLLAEEGAERLLDGSLADVPVLLLGVRGAEPDGVDGLPATLGAADADYRGALWLTDRFRLEDDGEVDALGEVLGFDPGATAGTLRAAAISRLARRLRPPADGATPFSTPDVLPGLLEEGFVEFDAPEGGSDDSPSVPAGARLVLVSGAASTETDRLLVLPLLRGLVAEQADREPALVLTAAEPAAEGSEAPGVVATVREDERLAARVSTVDHLDDFAGQLAAVLAVADLGAGRVGHFGDEQGADRLLPAPVG